MVPREIDLEEKRVYVSTPMIQVPFFSLPIDAAPKVPEIVMLVPSSVVAASTIPDITVLTPVATPPIPTVSEGLEPVIQEPPEPAVGHEEEVLQLKGSPGCPTLEGEGVNRVANRFLT